MEFPQRLWRIYNAYFFSFCLFPQSQSILPTSHLGGIGPHLAIKGHQVFGEYSRVATIRDRVVDWVKLLWHIAYPLFEIQVFWWIQQTVNLYSNYLRDSFGTSPISMTIPYYAHLQCVTFVKTFWDRLLCNGCIIFLSPRSKTHHFPFLPPMRVAWDLGHAPSTSIATFSLALFHLGLPLPSRRSWATPVWPLYAAQYSGVLHVNTFFKVPTDFVFKMKWIRSDGRHQHLRLPSVKSWPSSYMLQDGHMW